MYGEVQNTLMSEIAIPPEGSFFTSHSPEETQRLGEEFGKKLRPGSVVAVFGELGSGKTTFIAGVCRSLGVQEQVTSPTFTLIQEYSGKWPIYHFDFYRIERPSQAVLLGCDEYFYADGVCLIEWPHRISEYLPEKRIEVRLEHCFDQELGQSRTILIRQA